MNGGNATLRIPDWSISILLKLVNRNAQKERLKEMDCSLRLLMLAV
jgi:hypothetical protein